MKADEGLIAAAIDAAIATLEADGCDCGQGDPPCALCLWPASRCRARKIETEGGRILMTKYILTVEGDNIELCEYHVYATMYSTKQTPIETVYPTNYHRTSDLVALLQDLGKRIAPHAALHITPHSTRESPAHTFAHAKQGAE